MNSAHIARQPLSRRKLLRGLGVGLALPMLDCMNPVFGKSKIKPSHRMLLISNNLGVLPGPFFPKAGGADYELSPYLDLIKEFRNDFTICSGLSHPAVTGGHSTENCFLTGARDPTGSGFRNTQSLDQYAVEKLGQQTRFPTINLGVNINKGLRSLSWTRDGVLLPAEDSPSALFRRMFVQGNAAEQQRRLRQLRERGSILDAINDDMRRFEANVGPNDRHRLDQYFTSVRDLEQRLHAAGEWEKKPRPKTDREVPKDIPQRDKFFPKLNLMLSMAQLALETDSTRVVTLMVDAFATPVFDIEEKLRSLSGYHNLSHHGQDQKKIDQLEKVDRRQMESLKKLFTDLAKVPDFGGRLLDYTMVLYGSNMGDANVHNNTNLPVLLGGGGFTHGQHLAFDQHHNTPLANLFVSMLQRMGVESDEFSSSTGALAGLEPRA